jgi:hypothetical protein
VKAPKPRTVSGHKHEITFGYTTDTAMTKIQATCICDNFTPPARFDRRRAEEDGREHMEEFAKKGKGRPGKPGKESKWLESLQL